MVGRKNVYISHRWAAMLPTLRTTELEYVAKDRLWIACCQIWTLHHALGPKVWGALLK